MPRYTVQICPSEIADNSLEYSQGKTVTVAEQEDGSFVVTVYVCPLGSVCHNGQYTIVKLCPVGLVCGCNYSTDITWYAYNKDRVKVNWTNPDKCILDKIELKAKPIWGESWNTILKYIHEKSGDPSVSIYPDGDERNSEYCYECGLGGENGHPPGREEVWDTGIIIPGMMYRVDGFFRNESCGGVSMPVILGYSLYETPALTSGQVVEMVSEDPPIYKVKLYDPQNIPDVIYYSLYTVDHYPWSSGDSVMIMKDQKRYPTGEPTEPDDSAPGGDAYKRFGSSSVSHDSSSMIISAYEVLEGYYGHV